MPASLAAEVRPAAGGELRAWWAAGGLLALLALAFATWDPAVAPGPVLCLFRRATGLACPGCGLTRATALLARGRLADSLALHPGAVLLVFEIGVAWLLWGERLLVGRLRGSSRWVLPASVVTASAFLVLWLSRWLSGTLPV